MLANLDRTKGRRSMTEDGWLAIYLQDHSAATAATVSLLQRSAREQSRAEVRASLSDVAASFVADREVLDDVMDSLEVPVSRTKTAAAWLGEQAGRLKLNGRLAGRAPLSDVVELEGITLALTAVALGWTTLLELSLQDRRLNEEALRTVLRRCLDQRRRVEVLRLHCVREELMA